MNNTFQGLFLVFVATAMLAPSVVAEENLYDRMGGAPVVARVVDELMRLNRVDPRTKRSFQKISVKRFREKLNEQLCANAGGPCQYIGDDMKVVQSRLEIADTGKVTQVIESDIIETFREMVAALKKPR